MTVYRRYQVPKTERTHFRTRKRDSFDFKNHFTYWISSDSKNPHLSQGDVREFAGAQNQHISESSPSLPSHPINLSVPFYLLPTQLLPYLEAPTSKTYLQQASTPSIRQTLRKRRHRRRPRRNQDIPKRYQRHTKDITSASRNEEARLLRSQKSLHQLGFL